ncbi:MAG TPA: AMP-binding protein [Thermoanaerobaculia bacterium]|nr:AMP-binding protein [Thermoanaerobaculia bacterium]
MDTSLVERFARRLRRTPSAPAVLAAGAAASVSSVDAVARRLERALAELALPPGSLVGLAAPNGPVFLGAILALRRRELAVLLLDPGARPGERERLHARLGPRAILESSRAWPGESDGWFRLRELATPQPASGLTAPTDAVVKLTSGSTGEPRGIATPETALLADEEALARTMGVRDGERILGGIPWSHSYGLVSVALPVLVRDAVAVVPDPGDPLGALRALLRHEVTFVPTVPAWLRGLLRSGSAPDLPASLRLVVSAGAPLDAETAATFRRRHGRPVHVFYGASECGGITYDRTGEAGEHGHLGTPVEGVALEIEALAGERASEGLPGRVLVRSPAVARTYLPESDPDLGGGAFRTADIGWLDGERLRLTGRLDSLINVKGKKVQPSEVEGVLLQFPGVDEAVVLGPAHGAAGIRAVVALRPGLERPPRVDEILTFCRQRLADFKVPRSLRIVDSLPRTERGKLDRPAVLELATER